MDTVIDTGKEFRGDMLHCTKCRLTWDVEDGRSICCNCGKEPIHLRTTEQLHEIVQKYNIEFIFDNMEILKLNMEKQAELVKKHIHAYGTVPRKAMCPYIVECGTPYCGHEQNGRVVEYSCGFARGFAISEEK